MFAKLRARANSWRGLHNPFRFLKPLLVLGLPNCLAFGAELVVPYAAVIFLGKMATPELQGACLLGNMFANAFGASLVYGMAMGLDSLAPQADGSGNKALVGLYCQRGIIIGLLISVPLAVLWIFSSIFLQVIFRVDKKMADLSAEFIYGRLIGLPFITLFEVIRRFAQAQRLAWPTLVSCVVGASIHLLLTYFFILHFGLRGAGYAISASQILMVFVLLVILYCLRNSEALAGSWETPSVRELFSGWMQYLRVGAPAALSLFIEWGGWEVYASLSAQLGTVALATQSILNTTSALFYIVPMGMAQASATLVGNALGEGQAKHAQSCVLLGYASIVTFALLNGSLSFLYRNVYPLLFSNDVQVIELTSRLFVMMFVYALFDSTKAIGMALLRSTGRPTITVLGVFFAQLCVGYPVAFLLRSKGFGVEGVWWGSTSAWGCTGLTFAVLIFFTDFEFEVKQAQTQIELGILSRDVKDISLDNEEFGMLDVKQDVNQKNEEVQRLPVSSSVDQEEEHTA